jgi:hypothetical protein
MAVAAMARVAHLERGQLDARARGFLGAQPFAPQESVFFQPTIQPSPLRGR